MRRRQFITLLGGATVWPLALHAEEGAPRRRLGVLLGRSEQDAEGRGYVAALERGLAELGWSPHHNVEIDYRWQTDDPRRRLAIAKEVVARKPEVLVVNSTPYLRAAREATRAVPIPIVMVAIADPVAQGFVESLPRPGGTLTGFAVEEPAMGAKWVELLREIAPRVGSVTVVFNPDSAPLARMFVPAIEAARPAGASGDVTISPVGSETETEQAIAAAAGRPATGLIFLPDSFLSAHREFVVAAVARHRVPAIYYVATFARSGGLIAYGIDRADLFSRAANYVDRILKGAKPADLPVQMPTKFELAINLRTAKALSLEVPPTLLARADEVIE